jgi:cobalt/nickel transport system permease protein
MHIPDGFLDAKTLTASAVFAAAGVSAALGRARHDLPASRVPLLGMTAAFIFAAQMVNFPVLGGTSGHLIGSVLAAILLGPSGAIVALTAVLFVQAFLFADGGLLALGANVLNMAVVAPLSGYAVYWLLARWLGGRKGQLFAAGFAAWISVVVAATMCSGELAWSGAVPWRTVFPAMAGMHAVIGVGEGLITMLVLAAIMRAKPELIGGDKPPAVSKVAVVMYGLLLVAVVTLFIAPFASPWPDGLERVAATFGFSSRALGASGYASPFTAYAIPGINSPVLATGLAGLLGALVVAAVVFAFTFLIVPRAPGHDQAISSPKKGGT